MKKKCYLCDKLTQNQIVNRKIRGNVRCKVYECSACKFQYLDKKFV